MKSLVRSSSRWFPVALGAAIMLSSFAYALPRGQAYYRLNAQMISACGELEEKVSSDIDACKKDSAYGDYNMTTNDQGCRVVFCKKAVECRPFNFADAEKMCKMQGQGFERYPDGPCTYGRCTHLVDVPTKLGEPAPESSRSPCKTDQALEAGLQECRRQGGEAKLYPLQINGVNCQEVQCSPATHPAAPPPSTTPPPACPTEELLKASRVQCEQKNLAPETFKDGRCAYVRCKPRVEAPICPLLDQQIHECESKGLLVERFTEGSCARVRCSTTVISSCPSMDLLNQKIISCKSEGKTYDYVWDGKCRQVACKELPEERRPFGNDGIPPPPFSDDQQRLICPMMAVEQTARDCKESGRVPVFYFQGNCRMVRCSNLPPPFSTEARPPDDSPHKDSINWDQYRLEQDAPSVQEDRCAQLLSFIEKFGKDLPEEAAKAKMEYMKRCAPAEQPPSPKPTPAAEDICKKAREHMELYKNAGFANTKEFQDLEEKFQEYCVTAEKTTPPPPPPASLAPPSTPIPPAPPAEFEEEVLPEITEITNPFPDTDIDTETGKAFAELHQRSVIGGFPDGEAKPFRFVNRAEMAKFSLLACNRPIGNATKTKFHDVQPGQWYTKYVGAAAEQGIIDGNSDGTFHPASMVQRDQFLKMLSRACGLTESPGGSTYADVSATSWVEPYAWFAQKFNLFDSPDGRMHPEKIMSREDVAVALYRFLKAR